MKTSLNWVVSLLSVPPEIPSVLVQEDSLRFWQNQNDDFDENSIRLEYDDEGDLKDTNRSNGK